MLPLHILDVLQDAVEAGATPHLQYDQEAHRMPKLKTPEDLKKLRDEAQRDLKVRLETGTRVIIGMGTCGIAAGARETMQTILEELE